MPEQLEKQLGDTTCPMNKQVERNRFRCSVTGGICDVRFRSDCVSYLLIQENYFYTNPDIKQSWEETMGNS